MSPRNKNKNYVWQMAYMQKPTLNVGWPLYSGMNKIDPEAESSVENGHVCMQDNEYHAGAQFEHLVAVAPTLVRDLAGRLVHIGQGPLVKLAEEWANGLTKTFPRFCSLAPSSMEGKVYTSFRTLDVSLEMDARKSGQRKGADYVIYKNPNLYPYKLRLDSFYADGHRVPQTELLYVKDEGLTLTETESSAAEFFTKWEERGSLSYEEWYEKNDGESWFSSLFEKGVTVIPTLEACNGYNHVSADFELQDFWPGRAVSGLHKIVSKVQSDAPEGTILEVKKPGVAMARRIELAEVVVSDGSGYKTPHVNDPQPYLPDLRLPHTRCSAEWGACHLPTHPSHFEKPALWGWDELTGRFLQMSGPLWDPLHYYYKSVDEVVRSFKGEAGQTVFPVPEHMKTRFYPITTMHGYDVIDADVYASRKDANIRIDSAIRRKPLDEESSTLGYHPLPLEIEYELDNWWFPELAPNHRVQAAPPPALSKRLLGVIRSNVSPSYYAKEVEGQDWWIADTDNLKIATGRALEDYPFLIRYLGAENDLSKSSEWFTLHLEHIEEEVFQSSAYQLWPDDKPETLDRVSTGYFSALMDMRTKGLELTGLRHRMFREFPEYYYAAFWSMISTDDLIAELQEIERSAQQGQADRQNQSTERYLLDESGLKRSDLGGALEDDDGF